MKIRVQNKLLLLNVVAISLIIVIAFFPFNTLRIILGVPLVLFIPGYTLLSALFPRRGSLNGIERTAFSFGLSIAITILIGVILNYTPWGISLYPILTSITLFIIVTSSLAWYRRWRLSPAERPSVTVNISLAQWGKMGSLNKMLSVSLVVAIVVALVSLGYVITRPRESERFTEFYILGVDGKAENYPQQVMRGETVELIIGIVNHEQEVTSYRIDIEIDDGEVGQIRTDALARGEKWEEIVSFIPQNSGENRKVGFWLYKDGETTPYFKDPLHLYLDVNEPPPG